MSYNVIVFDFETTGLSPEFDRIIEFSFLNSINQTHYSSLVNPKMPIPSQSIKIHGITDDQVADYLTFHQLLPKIMDFIGPNAYLIGHNADGFDIKFFNAELNRCGFKLPENWKVIDTLKIGRTLFPDLKSHKQDAFRDMYELTKSNAHKAIKDVLDLEKIFNYMKKDNSIDEMYQISKNFVFSVMPFGKYRGTKIIDVPEDYVNWMLKSGFFNNNPDLHKAFLKYEKI